MSRPRIAVIGAGHMGRLHVQKLAELEREGRARLVGIHDLHSERSRSLAAEFGARTLPDLEAVGASADAAFVAVPTTEHARVAQPLLEAGLDLLVEKPLAAGREEARAMVTAARDHGRLLQVGHVERYSPALRGILPMLKRPRFIEAHRLSPYPERGTDVSVVLDLMIHDLDIVAQLAGSDVDAVDAIGVPILSKTEDIANARVRFSNGCVLNITASRVSREKMRKIRVFQEDAYLSIDLANGKITVMRLEGRPADGGEAKILSEDLEFDEGDALLMQAGAFVDAVRDRRPPEVDGEAGYRALDLALRIQESLAPLEVRT